MFFGLVYNYCPKKHFTASQGFAVMILLNEVSQSDRLEAVLSLFDRSTVRKGCVIILFPKFAIGLAVAS